MKTYVTKSGRKIPYNSIRNSAPGAGNFINAPSQNVGGINRNSPHYEASSYSSHHIVTTSSPNQRLHQRATVANVQVNQNRQIRYSQGGNGLNNVTRSSHHIQGGEMNRQDEFYNFPRNSQFTNKNN